MIVRACMHTLKKGRKLENKNRIIKVGISGWYKNKRDKIGMGYDSLCMMELLSVQCLQVDDVIPDCRLAENHNFHRIYIPHQKVARDMHKALWSSAINIVIPTT